MNENILTGANINEGASKELPYKKKGMPKGAKIALIIVSIVLVVALLFGALLTAVLGFFGVLVFLIVYLVTPENDGTFTYEVYGDTVEIVGLLDGDLEGTMKIPEYIDGKPVTRIQSYAFSFAYGIEEVYIPSTVTSIGLYAFEGCENLRSVYMGDGVEIIEDWAFSGCYALETVELSESLIEIRSFSFNDCRSLGSITIPQSVTLIDPYVFDGCESLVAVIFEDPYGWTIDPPDGGTHELSPERLEAPGWGACSLLRIYYSDRTWAKKIAE